MTETSTVALDVNIKSKQAEESIGNIRTRLKEAKNELTSAIENFGEFSKEAVKAAQKVEGLKGTIDDASRLVKAFDGDRKFAAFGSAISTVANGFTAAQGAIGLFGSESEEVESILKKVNSAMALSQGIDGVLEGIKSFKDLRAVVMSFSIVQKAATAAQLIFNAVMAANPIGVLIVAITALIAGVVALTSYFMSNAKANRENAKAVKENAKALEEQKKANEKANNELAKAQSYQIAMAKANGATTASIRALELKLIDEKIATERASRETALNTLQKERNTLASKKQADASDEVIKGLEANVQEALKQANEQTENLNKSLLDRVELQRKHNVEVAAETTAANNNAIQKQKQQSEAAAAERKRVNDERIAQDKKNEEEEQKRIADLREKRIKDTREFVKAERQEVTDELEKTRQEGEQRANDLVQKNIELRLKNIADAKQKAADELALQNALAANQEEKDKIRVQSIQSVSNALGVASDIIGKETAAGKSLAVAQALINTYLGASEVIKAKSTLPEPYGTISKIASVAAIIATGIKTVKAITSVKVPGRGSSGGAASIPSTPITPPVAPQAETTRLEQGQINQIGNAAGRAFVVESDITGNQEKIRRLNRQARIN